MNEEQIPQNHADGNNDRNDAQSETAQLPVTNESVELLPEELAAQEENAQPITADSLAAPLPSDVPSAPAESVEQPVMNEPVSGSDASAVSFQDSDEAVLGESRRHTRRSFVVAGAGVAAAAGFTAWLNTGLREQAQPALLRRAFQANATLARTLGANAALAPTYPLARAENLRVNGDFGLKQQLVPESWRLQLVGVRDAVSQSGYSADVTSWEYRYEPTAASSGSDNQPRMTEDDNHTGRKPRGLEEAGESDSTLLPRTPGLLLSMDQLAPFPRRELVTQFKCIEGWSQVVHWAGIRLADFLDAYPPALVNGKEPRFIYMETPNGDYYTGYDLAVCRHPQTLLVTEMMGAPLTQPHGAPLRLHMPTKYGYKQIKRIGLIAYMDVKPDDYWTKLGYDWYAGL
jgi:hypothetical protein